MMKIPFLNALRTKDVLLKRIEHEDICCDTHLVIHGRF